MSPNHHKIEIYNFERLISNSLDMFNNYVNFKQFEQAIEESEEDMALRMRAAMSAGTPPSSPVVIRGEPMRKCLHI